MNRRSQQTVVFADSDTGGIVHVANIKGGVGKSTVATNLAAVLAKRGPTLLIDLDVQGSASVAFGVSTADCRLSSWELFRRRFASPDSLCPAPATNGSRVSLLSRARALEQKLVPWFVGKGDVTTVARHISQGLDLVPANADLFKPVYFHHLQNLLHNLQLCRSYYKYIIIDTPSVWNNLTRSLYRWSDLNLIPVTLTALSTKSLKDYLHSVRRLAERHRRIRIRIVKNEVFGKDNSKVKGKTRTTGENRRFLEKLCEQVMVRNHTGVSLLPQSILFDLEIPESAVVRDAQDEGVSVDQIHQYAAATKAFEELARRVQFVLNENADRFGQSFWERHEDSFAIGSRIAAVAALAFIFGGQVPVRELGAPRPIAPQQLVESSDHMFAHTFSQGESMFKIAKYAICRFRAVVPRAADVHAYIREAIQVHNLTRSPGEERIDDAGYVAPGTSVTFYPPACIVNPQEKQLVPVYRFFTSLVQDPFSYVTGDWCERGTGGGTPHYGIDVAAALGSKIRSPIDGTVMLLETKSTGRTVGIVSEGYVIFFCHMDQRFFRSGARVRKGEIIGTVGMTGATSGPHAHIGYGVRSMDYDGIQFGRVRYRLTDPKLFFYRQEYLDEVSRKG